MKDTKDGKDYAYDTKADNPSVTSFLHAQTTYIESLNTYAEVNAAIQHNIKHLALTQLGMKGGIKMWGQQGVEVILKEMKQFHDLNVVRPLLPNEIFRQTKSNVLGYLVFLKKKRNGNIKGRSCADGRSQRVYKSNEENFSPTACILSIVSIAIIEVYE